jgi:hypothetical protein
MTTNVSSPVNGGAQTGFTSPTYTLVADQATDVNMKQWAVTGVGGAGNTPALHSASSPFSTSMWKPKVFKQLGTINPATGRLANVPINVYKGVTRKGTVPLAGQPAATSYIKSEIGIAAGADTASPIDVRAMISLHIGMLNQISAGLGDTAVTGLL